MCENTVRSICQEGFQLHRDKKLKSLPAGKKLSQLDTNAVFLEKPGLPEEPLKQQDKLMVHGLDEVKVRLQVARDQTMVML
jgi:hypothetical protein